MWTDRLPTVTGERLALRWLEETDAESLFTVFDDPEVIRFWSSPGLADVDEAQRMIANVRAEFAAGLSYKWGVEERASKRVVGIASLQNLNLPHKRAEVGIALGSATWGRGYGTEALGLLLDVAFDELGLHRLEADVDPNNPRSLALFEKLGFRREGYLRERWHLFGAIQDTVLLGLLACDRLDRNA